MVFEWFFTFNSFLLYAGSILATMKKHPTHQRQMLISFLRKLWEHWSFIQEHWCMWASAKKASQSKDISTLVRENGNLLPFVPWGFWSVSELYLYVETKDCMQKKKTVYNEIWFKNAFLELILLSFDVLLLACYLPLFLDAGRIFITAFEWY